MQTFVTQKMLPDEAGPYSASAQRFCPDAVVTECWMTARHVRASLYGTIVRRDSDSCPPWSNNAGDLLPNRSQQTNYKNRPTGGQIKSKPLPNYH